MCEYIRDQYLVQCSVTAESGFAMKQTRIQKTIDLSRISQNDKFAECDSRKMPCNCTISKVEAIG